MNIYHVSGPKHSPWQALRLRVMAYKPTKWDQDTLKVVVQVFDASGALVADDPIEILWMLPLEFLGWMADSMRDGWEFEPVGWIGHD